MIAVLALLALASPPEPPTAAWTAKAKSAQKRGGVFLRADDTAAARPGMCEAFFYFSKVLEATGSDEAVRGAFNTAYSADLFQTAAALFPRIRAPNENELLLKADLDQQAELVDVPCPAHVVACGDAILDGGESCDDGNLSAGDGCSVSCTVESAAPTAPPTSPSGSPTAPPPESPASPAEAAHIEEPSSSLSPVALGAGGAGAVALVTSAAALIIGVHQNGQMNAEDTTGARTFLLEADDRKGAEDARNLAYVVSGIAAGVGVIGIGVGVVSWE